MRKRATSAAVVSVYGNWRDAVARTSLVPLLQRANLPKNMLQGISGRVATRPLIPVDFAAPTARDPEGSPVAP